MKHLQGCFSLGRGISKTTLLFRGPNWSQLVIMALKNTQKHKKRCFLHKRTVDIFWPNKAYHRREHAQSYVNQKKVSHTINAHRMETWQTECMYTTTVLLKHKWIHESSSEHFCPSLPHSHSDFRNLLFFWFPSFHNTSFISKLKPQLSGVKKGRTQLCNYLHRFPYNSVKAIREKNTVIGM